MCCKGLISIWMGDQVLAQKDFKYQLVLNSKPPTLELMSPGIQGNFEQVIFSWQNMACHPSELSAIRKTQCFQVSELFLLLGKNSNTINQAHLIRYQNIHCYNQCNLVIPGTKNAQLNPAQQVSLLRSLCLLSSLMYSRQPRSTCWQPHPTALLLPAECPWHGPCHLAGWLLGLPLTLPLSVYTSNGPAWIWAPPPHHLSLWDPWRGTIPRFCLASTRLPHHQEPTYHTCGQRHRWDLRCLPQCPEVSATPAQWWCSTRPSPGTPRSFPFHSSSPEGFTGLAWRACASALQSGTEPQLGFDTGLPDGTAPLVSTSCFPLAQRKAHLCSTKCWVPSSTLRIRGAVVWEAPNLTWWHSTLNKQEGH